MLLIHEMKNIPTPIPEVNNEIMPHADGKEQFHRNSRAVDDPG